MRSHALTLDLHNSGMVPSATWPRAPSFRLVHEDARSTLRSHVDGCWDGPLGLFRSLPSGGTVSLTMKALAGLLCLLLAGCVTPASSSPSPTPSASITFVCGQDTTYCSGIPAGGVLERAILTAVAGVGYPVKTVTFSYMARSCPVPPAPPCLAAPGAYVSFVGSDLTAEVQIGTEGGGPQLDSVKLWDVWPPPSAAP